MPRLVITNYPSKITTDQFKVDLTIEGAKPATNYLKILIYKEGSTDYLNVKGGSNENYFPVTITSKSTEVSVEGRVVESLENGNYKLKVRRYTASGNPADDEVNEVNVQIEMPVATSPPTPQETMIPTPTMIVESIKSPGPEIKAAVNNKPKPVLAVATKIPEIKIENVKVENQNILVPASMFFMGLLFIGVSVFLTIRRYNEKNAKVR